MKGFAPLPSRGDGHSEWRANEILRTDSQFRYETPENVAEIERKNNVDRWLKQVRYRDTVTEEMLFCPPRSRGRNTLSFTRPDGTPMKAIRWDYGYWGVMLMKEGVSKNKKWDWQIHCHVGEVGCVAPAVIRKQIVSDLGEDSYERFKRRQWDDIKSLKWCLNQACKHLAKDNGVALSWVTSPSSQRLIEELQIRTEREWAFLFGHYTWDLD
jgi:hypothetical protein